MLKKEKMKKISSNFMFDKDFMTNFRHNIDLYIKEKDFTIKELSESADVPFSTLNNILYKDTKDVHLSTALAIAKALNVSIDELIGGKTMEDKMFESIRLCRSLPEHSLYLIRYFIRHQAKIYSCLDEDYISVLLPKYENGIMSTTNIVEPMLLSNIPPNTASKVYLGLKIPSNNYMPYYQAGEIILIAADRPAVCGEQCIVTSGGGIYIVEKHYKKDNYYSSYNQCLIPEDKIDDVIGYVVGFLDLDGNWGIR